MYCSDTVFKLNNKLYYILDTRFINEKDYSLACHELPMTKYSTSISILSTEDIDWNPFILGYLNIELYDDTYSVIFTSRAPIRLWKLGFPITRIQINNIILYIDRPTIQQILYNPISIACLQDNYFTLNDIQNKLETYQAVKLAINKKLIINRGGNISYHLNSNIEIGKLVHSTFFLNKKFKYLLPNIENMELSCKVR